MNPNEHGPTLTADQTFRLVAFLAERGHRQEAFEILTAALPTLILAAYEELTR